MDDESDILLLLGRALRHYGIFEVDTFSEPLIALDHFKDHANDYSIVVSDIRMPAMSGIEFLQQVKRIRPDIPVLAMTAFETFDLDIPAELAGMTKEEIVQKPFKLVKLCDAVKKTLKILA